MSDSGETSSPLPARRRVIKRYSNRKLYDTQDSRYVTLLEIAEYVRAGEDVQVIDNATKEDKTDVTLALIISEELKARPKGIPLSTLRSLIFEHGERLLNQLREGPIGKLVPWESEMPSEQPATAAEGPPPELGEQRKSSPISAVPSTKTIRATLEQWQQTIDDRIRATLPDISAYSELPKEVQRLTERVAQLEAKLAEREAPPPEDP